jgi:cysteine desulfurase family protein (TIGR01976 family)
MTPSAAAPAFASPDTAAIAAVRAHFPSLSGDTIFLDNAGGSQMPRVVADAMHRYMLSSFVQTGADYAESRRASAVVRRAHDLVKVFLNACPDHALSEPKAGSGEVILGGSTSTLCRMLADCYADILHPGDEVVICDTAHESNAGPWARLASRGIIVRTWNLDPGSARATEAGLRRVLSTRTRIVAFPQVSNILGEIVDVPALTRIAQEAGARVVVDGVAYAPHRLPDVAAWGVDWYVFSTYKVFGPHMAALFGTHDALAELTGPNHFFIPRDEVPRKFELGGANHESCAGVLALDHYLEHFLAALGMPEPSPRLDSLCVAHPLSRERFRRAFAAIESIELPLQRQFMAFLRGFRHVRIIGPASGDAARVCTIAFVRDGVSSRSIAQACNAQNLGVRFGNFYAYRLCKALALDPADGVVRVSLAHYNTHDELARLQAALTPLLA